MGTVNLSKHLNTVYPQKSGAEDIRNLPAHDLQQAVTRILEEAAGNILHYLKGKLPAEIFENLDSKGSLNEKVYGVINRHYQEVSDHYAVSDDQDEAALIKYHTAGEIAELLRSRGGADQFNNGEIEKSADRNLNDLEAHTNNLLRHKTGTGMFLNQGGAGSVVKCVFRDNAHRPKTVTDLKLSINVPDSALINPVFYRHAAAKYLIKDLISRHIIESIDRAADASADQELEERITGILAEIASPVLDMADLRENVKKSADIETIRTCGFNAAASLLVSILDYADMGCQFIENAQNGRELTIREYEDHNEANLPDERYQIRLHYCNPEQLAQDRAAYDAQVKHLESRVRHLWDLIEVVYQDSKSVFKVNDFEDLAKKNKSRIRDLIKQKNGEALYDTSGEIPTQKDRPGGDFGDTRRTLARMYERIKNMYEFLYPVERRVMEERLALLEKEYYHFDFVVNPWHLRPGLLIDVNLSSIKRKKTTLDSMAYTLNEFLRRVSVGFYDAALAVFDSRPPAAAPAKTGRKRRSRKLTP